MVLHSLFSAGYLGRYKVKVVLVYPVKRMETRNG